MHPAASAAQDATTGGSATATTLRNYFLAVAACALTAAIATPLSRYFDLANIVMLFLLAVVLVALRLGRGPAVLAAFLSVAMFDFFFVPPRFSFTVNDAQYLLTFGVMLAVALIIGQLTAGLKQQAELASAGEQRASALYEMARELAGALTVAQVAEISWRFLHKAMRVQAMLLLPDAGGELKPAADDGDEISSWIDPRLAIFAYENAACTDVNAPRAVGYFPLKAPTRVCGVLAVASPDQGSALLLGHRELLETVASLIAIAVERLHFVEVAHGAQVQMASGAKHE